ncbi:unnamed protein product [Amoebophrya sp. A25]|nr:unnamed protein product [Amoebophrya sp. A25]|eukprot:GSA25T00021807001.1
MDSNFPHCLRSVVADYQPGKGPLLSPNPATRLYSQDTILKLSDHSVGVMHTGFGGGVSTAVQQWVRSPVAQNMCSVDVSTMLPGDSTRLNDVMLNIGTAASSSQGASNGNSGNNYQNHGDASINNMMNMNNAATSSTSSSSSSKKSKTTSSSEQHHQKDTTTTGSGACSSSTSTSSKKSSSTTSSSKKHSSSTTRTSSPPSSTGGALATLFEQLALNGSASGSSLNSTPSSLDDDEDDECESPLAVLAGNNIQESTHHKKSTSTSSRSSSSTKNTITKTKKIVKTIEKTSTISRSSSGRANGGPLGPKAAVDTLMYDHPYNNKGSSSSLKKKLLMVDRTPSPANLSVDTSCGSYNGPSSGRSGEELYESDFESETDITDSENRHTSEQRRAIKERSGLVLFEAATSPSKFLKEQTTTATVNLRPPTSLSCDGGNMITIMPTNFYGSTTSIFSSTGAGAAGTGSHPCSTTTTTTPYGTSMSTVPTTTTTSACSPTTPSTSLSDLFSNPIPTTGAAKTVSKNSDTSNRVSKTTTTSSTSSSTKTSTSSSSTTSFFSSVISPGGVARSGLDTGKTIFQMFSGSEKKKTEKTETLEEKTLRKEKEEIEREWVVTKKEGDSKFEDWVVC